MASYCSVWWGGVWSLWLFLVGYGGVRSGEARLCNVLQGKVGKVAQGGVQRGVVMFGGAWLGEVRLCLTNIFSL